MLGSGVEPSLLESVLTVLSITFFFIVFLPPVLEGAKLLFQRRNVSNAL